MNFNIITLFPEMFDVTLELGVTGRAVVQGKAHVQLINPRHFTEDVHQTVDDRPYGGGDGMLMMMSPLAQALKSLQQKGGLGHVVYLSPQGQRWSDAKARDWGSQKKTVTLICGRYAGVDQRLVSQYVDEEISLGDFVLSGGELAAQVIVDSTLRFVPGVLGNEESPQAESFARGLLEGPSFTRPQKFEELPVPEVLLSGDHAKIEEFRLMMALAFTCLRRPDLLNNKMKGQLLKARDYLKKMSDLELKSCGLTRQQLEGLAEGE